MKGLSQRSNLLGQRFGTLTVVGFSRRENRDGGTRLFWMCRCECGDLKEVVSPRLRSGRQKTCGSPVHRTQYVKMRSYTSLEGAIARCHNRRMKSYKDYGGRGITVCDRWRLGEGGKTGFECFLDDMGERPEGLSLDRIDVDGDYGPENCRWADKKTQQQNQRRAIYANIGGVNVPLKRYVARVGLVYESVRFRVRKRGETVQQASRALMKRGF